MKKTFTKVASVLFVAIMALWTSNASAQDGCVNALTINCGDQVFGSTVGLSVSDYAGAFCGTGQGTGGSAWYVFTGTGDLITASLCGGGTTYDSRLHVYSGACGAYVCEAGNDDFCGLQSEVGFTSVLGTTYYIVVGGFGASEGTYQLDLTCAGAVPGCTDPGACNFDPAATVDDGTCEYLSCSGCTDGTACNFDPAATVDDGSCDYSCIGCTDPLACNYDVAHTVEDGSCCFDTCIGLVVGGGTFDGEIGWSLTDDLGTIVAAGGAGSFDLCLLNGDACYTYGMTDSFGDGWNGATYTFTDALGNVIATGDLDTATDGDGVSIGSEVIQVGAGCTPGCTDPLACNFDPLADFNVGCDFISCAGCTDPFAANYDPAATIDDGSCVFCDAGAGEILAILDMTDSFGDGWNGATYTVVELVGGTIVATGDLDLAQIGDGISVGTDGFCLAAGCYTIEVGGGTFDGEIGWSLSDQIGNNYGGGGANLGTPANIDFGFTGTCAFEGCTDPAAINFDPNASVDNGTCVFPPANNDVCNAEAVQCGVPTTGTTINSSDNEGLIGSTCGTAVTSPGVWYVFNAAADEQVTVSTCNSLGGDTKITVYAAAPDCNNLVCIGGNDDGCGVGFLSSFSFTAQTGNDYYILVSEFGAGVGIDFQLDIDCIACGALPPNDDCVNAIPLPTDDTPINGNTCCANPSDAPNFAAGFGTAYDVWYVVNSQNFDTFFFNLLNNGGSEVGLMVYDGACGTLVDIAGCVVTGQCAGNIADFLTITPNTDYYFAIFTTDAPGCGDFSIQILGQILGCTDPAANNYDPLANEDDGSCDYTGVVPANDECANAIAVACNSTTSGSTGGATAVGTTGGFPGCDAAPGSGVWYSFVGTGELTNISTCGSVIDSKISILDGPCGGPYACAGASADSFADCGFFDQDDASVTFVSTLGTNYLIYVGAEDVDGDPFTDDNGLFTLDISCEPVVEGCTNPVAYNYDPTANVDDGTCDFFSQTCGGGAGVPVIFNMVDTFGDGWNGATYDIQLGDGTSVATGSLETALYAEDNDNFLGNDFGFDLLCLQDGCYNIIVGGGTFDGEIQWDITDENGIVLVSGGAGTASVTIGAAVCGCTDPGACNFDPAATDDDGSCEFVTCAGCTDPLACNFDATATIEDGTCCFDTCLDVVVGGGTFDEEIGWTLSDIDGNVLASGGAGEVSLCLPNPDYCFVFDMTDSFGDGWNGASYTVTSGGVLVATGNLDTAAEGDGVSVGTDTFGIGTGCITGCTEPVACNYDPAANIPDCEACEYSSCLGCTYVDADNYDPAAIIDDGSCTGLGSNDCPADFDDNQIINAADLLFFLSQFGTNCPQ